MFVIRLDRTPVREGGTTCTKDLAAMVGQVRAVRWSQLGARRSCPRRRHGYTHGRRCGAGSGRCCPCLMPKAFRRTGRGCV